MTEERKISIIAGPCSVENEEQLRKTLGALDKLDFVQSFRAGVWKPRTRPGMFEGIGEKALPWLADIQKQYNKPVMVEVAQPQHVESCLKHGINHFWLGARTVTNPFSVQEIANIIKDQDIHVWVKNPLHPDVELWMGAIERILASNVTEVVAIHRGFSSYKTYDLRNQPNWGIPIEVMRCLPEVKMICDPSHITGRADKIQEIAQIALDLNMDGLMIETHYQPENALTDAKQQISPLDLKRIYADLKIRKPHSSEMLKKSMSHMRNYIDELDTEMLSILAKRMETVQKLGLLKLENNATILQIERWKSILSDRLEQAELLDLNKPFILKLMQEIHKEAIKLQEELISKTPR